MLTLRCPHGYFASRSWWIKSKAVRSRHCRACHFELFSALEDVEEETHEAQKDEELLGDDRDHDES